MAEGMFGSNVRAGSAPRTTPFLAPTRKPLKVSVPTMPAAPHVSAPHVALHSPSLAAATSDAIGSFHATSLTPAGGATNGGGGGGLMGDINAVEGFFGHLGSDVVHTAMGFPVGIAYMFQHPIAGAEGMVQATWHDWSPLFHGDVRTWLHNTYEHPLAPILDVLSFATLGAGSVARGATLLGRAGEATAGAESVARAADATAQAGKAATAAAGTTTVHGFAVTTAEDAARAAGDLGTKAQAVEWWQKFQRFGHPTQYAASAYRQMAENLGYSSTAADTFVERALTSDPSARIRDVSKASVEYGVKDVNRNPALRVRDQFVRKGSQAIRDKMPSKLKAANDNSWLLGIGKDARYTRWDRIDRGSRKSSVGNLLLKQILVLHDQGKLLVGMKDEERVAHLHPAMRGGIVAHSIPVRPAADVAKQAEQVQAEAKQFLTSEDAYNAGVKQALNEVKAGSLSADDFIAKKWSKLTTTDDPALALRDAQGNFRVVSAGLKDAGRQVAAETFFSNKVVKLLYTNPTKIWRYLLLGASPRYFVNNFVGNSLMLAAATDPVSMVRAFHDYMHIRGFGKKMDKLVTTAGQTIEKAARGGGSNSLERWLGQEYGFGQANRIRIDPKTGAAVVDKHGAALLEKKGIVGRLPALHGVTHKYADMPQRYMAALYTLRRMPTFQSAYAELRASGKGVGEAIDGAVDRSMASHAVRMQVREQMHHMLGQYHTFAPGETLVQRVVPFYSWDRAIAAHMKHLITQEPYKVAMGAALGTLGSVKTQELMGQVPDFMRSMIPAKLLSGPFGLLGSLIGVNSTGRTGVLNAMSLSPYGSIGDETNALMAAAGMGHLKAGDSLGTMLNPMIQGFAAQMAGVDLTTGMPVKQGAGGPIVGTYLKAFGNVPQLTLINALIGNEPPSITSSGKPTLYEKDRQAAISSFLGLPMRQVNLATANAMAAQEIGKKKRPALNTTFPGL